MGGVGHDLKPNTLNNNDHPNGFCCFANDRNVLNRFAVALFNFYGK